MQTKALILTSFRQGIARGMNRNKRNGYKLLIHAQGEDSKVGELIYPLRRVVLMKFIQNEPIPIRNMKEIHDNSKKVLI